MTLPDCTAARPAISKISSLLDAWLGLLMSTYVGMPVSWTIWQMIFTAGHRYSFHLHPFLLLFCSLLPSHPSDGALFCLRAFFSGLLPKLPLRGFQLFSSKSHTIPFPPPFSFTLWNPFAVYISSQSCTKNGQRTLCY